MNSSMPQDEGNRPTARTFLGMSRAVQNTIANFVGQAGSSGLTLLFSIVYFRILGSENFGLVSFCTTLLLIGNLFVDFGLGRSVTRELARREHNPALEQEMRDALFTLQTIHFGLATLCGVAIAFSAQWLAQNWLQLGSVSPEEATHSIMLLGAVALLQLPRELCRSALAGLQRQVRSNVLATVFAALRGVISIAALLLFGPTITVFLAAQVIASVIETGAMVWVTWGQMPKPQRRAHFSLRVLQDVWMFAFNDGAAIAIGVGLQLSDRIVLSKLLPLETFGNYSLSVLIADIILRIVGPFSNAYFPHFADMLARKDSRLEEEYNRISVVSAAVVVPSTLILVFFAGPILQLITGKPEVAAAFALALALRASANCIIGFQYMTHALQLAAGNASIGLLANVLNIALYVPGMLYFTPLYGYNMPGTFMMAGATFQTILMTITTYRIVLKQSGPLPWVLAAIVQPIIICALVVGISAWIGRFIPLLWITYLPLFVLTGSIAAILTLAAAPQTRPLLRRVLQMVTPRAREARS